MVLTALAGTSSRIPFLQKVAAEKMFSDAISPDRSGRFMAEFPFENSDVPSDVSCVHFIVSRVVF